jgi:hypothetical protein
VPSQRRLLSLRGLVVVLAITAITASLANRFVRLSIDKTPAVHSLTSKAKIQHRDRDADEPTFAAADFSLLWVAEPATTIERVQPVYVRVQYDSLYNRPPPRS